MRACQIIAFALLIVATALASRDRAWVLAGIAAALAFELVPSVFELTTG